VNVRSYLGRHSPSLYNTQAIEIADRHTVFLDIRKFFLNVLTKRLLEILYVNIYIYIHTHTIQSNPGRLGRVSAPHSVHRRSGPHIERWQASLRASKSPAILHVSGRRGAGRRRGGRVSLRITLPTTRTVYCWSSSDGSYRSNRLVFGDCPRR